MSVIQAAPQTIRNCVSNWALRASLICPERPWPHEDFGEPKILLTSLRLTREALTAIIEQKIESSIPNFVFLQYLKQSNLYINIKGHFRWHIHCLLERLASLLVLVTKVLLGSFCKEVTNVEKDEGIQNISLLKSLEFWLGKRAALQMSFQRV